MRNSCAKVPRKHTICAFLRNSALAALIATPTIAQPDRISFPLYAEHINANLDFNQITPGIIVTWEDRGPWKLDYSAGIYINSFNDLSAIGTAAKMWPITKTCDAGIFGGIAYAPDASEHFLYHAGNFIPVAGLLGRCGNGFVQIMPGGGKSADAIVVLGLTVPLGGK